MTSKIADDTASIAQRLKEIEAEKMAAIMGKPLEDPQPTEAPKDIDWGMYAPCGYTVSATFGFTPFAASRLVMGHIAQSPALIAQCGFNGDPTKPQIVAAVYQKQNFGPELK